MHFKSSGVVVIKAALTVVLLAASLMAEGDNDGNLQTDIITSVPRSMTYQGILKDTDGEGIPDSFFDVTFRIFDAESDGTQMWSQVINVGTDGTGMFTAELTNMIIPFDVDYWLELEIDSEVLIPRQKLTMVGYAARADTADYALATPDGGSKWTVTDGILQTNELWGIIRGGADNYHGDSSSSIDVINFGIACTTNVTLPDSPGYVTISGGYANKALDNGATVGGGENNRAGSFFATVSGGSNNNASYQGATVAGGNANTASFLGATVSGGQENIASGGYSVIAGGVLNRTEGSESVVGGGNQNRAHGTYSVIGGGFNNLANDNYVSIGGGRGNTVFGTYSVITGGYQNEIGGSADYSYLFGIESILTEDSTFMVDLPHIRFGDQTSGYEFPTDDGTAGQVMATDGTGQLSWTDMTGDTSNGWVDNGTTVTLETQSDNVGIGTAAPNAKLDVNGDIWAQGNLIVDNSASITGQIDAYGIIIDQFRLTIGASANNVLTSDASGNGTWQPFDAIEGGGAANYLSKFISGDEVGNSIVFDNGTNVGIGTTTPSHKLEVSGDISTSGNLLVDGSAAVAGDLNAWKADVINFQMNTGASSGYVLTSDNSGNGIWQPIDAVQGSGAANRLAKFIGTTTVGNSQIYESGGYIGIGTPSPSRELEVNGRILANYLMANGDASIAGSVNAGGDVSAGGDISTAGVIEGYAINVYDFSLSTGASTGYVLTSDASGNGTWQPLPSLASSDKLNELESRINNLMNIIDSQNEKINSLESRLAELENR